MAGLSRPRLPEASTGFVIAGLAILVVSLVLLPIDQHLGILNVGLVFLLLTLLVSARYGRSVGVVTAFSANFVLNIFFTEPRHRFAIDEWADVLGLFVFLGVSIVGGTLLASARAAAAQAQRRQEDLEILLRLSQTLNAQNEPQAALSALCSEVVRAFGGPGASVLSQREGAWTVLASAGHERAGRVPGPRERTMAEQALTAEGLVVVGDASLRPRRTARDAQAQPEHDETAVFVPLRAGDRAFGVLRLDGPLGGSEVSRGVMRLLEPFVTEAALAVHRLELAQAAAHADALRQADELKTALMTSISHDLKTPLAGIKASVTSLLDSSVSWSDEDRQEFLAAIESQSDRLDRVISDILNLTRIEQGTVAPFMESVSARELLHEARERTENTTRGRDVIIDAPDTLDVRVDEALIVQALVNLIENAAKYSRPFGTIRLVASQCDETVELAVEDSGPGVSPQDLPHIFDRFYRGSSRNQRTNGSGLGLAVVRGFVRLCGGEAFAESASEGTRFVIRLPAAARSEAKG